MGYDARSQQILSVKPRGYPTYFTHDLVGRLTESKDALGGVRSMAYDSVGNKTLALDELGNPSYWAYDQANRVRAFRDAEQNQTYFGWDAVGQMRIRKEPDGRTMSFGYMGYDASRRPTRQSFSVDPWIYYTYDALGNRTQAEDATSTSVFEFDALDRLTKKVTLAGAVYYEWDKTGKKASLKDPTLVETRYVHDAVGRLTKVQLVDSGDTAYFHYDRAGNALNKPGPGNTVIAYYTHDAAGRLASLVNFAPDFPANGGNVVSYVYTRDENGQTTKHVREDGGYVYFEFDSLDRLARERHFSSGNSLQYGFQYDYDAASNRTKKHNSSPATPVTDYYQYNSRNLLDRDWRVQGASSTASYFQWDSSSRMARRATDTGAGANAEAQYYSYNQRNAVSKIAYQEVGSAFAQYFLYDGTGERLTSRFSGSYTYLNYDQQKPILERAGASTSRYRYNDGPVAGAMIESDLPGNTTGIGFDENGTIVLAYQDEDVYTTRLHNAFGERLNTFAPPGGSPNSPTLGPWSDTGLMQIFTTAAFPQYVQRDGVIAWPGEGIVTSTPLTEEDGFAWVQERIEEMQDDGFAWVQQRIEETSAAGPRLIEQPMVEVTQNVGWIFSDDAVWYHPSTWFDPSVPDVKPGTAWYWQIAEGGKAAFKNTVKGGVSSVGGLALLPFRPAIMQGQLTLAAAATLDAEDRTALARQQAAIVNAHATEVMQWATSPITGLVSFGQKTVHYVRNPLDAGAIPFTGELLFTGATAFVGGRTSNALLLGPQGKVGVNVSMPIRPIPHGALETIAPGGATLLTDLSLAPPKPFTPVAPRGTWTGRDTLIGPKPAGGLTLRFSAGAAVIEAIQRHQRSVSSALAWPGGPKGVLGPGFSFLTNNCWTYVLGQLRPWFVEQAIIGASGGGSAAASSRSQKVR